MSETDKKTALERGTRVKLLRQIAKLTRKEMQEKYNVNHHTLNAWEKGANCLTEQKAEQIIEYFKKENLHITKEWLLYGDTNSILNDNILNKNPELESGLNIRGDLKILKETNYFCSTNINAITIMITDDALLPIYHEGDYVGGIKCFDTDIKNLIGEICILTDENNKNFVRKIFKYNEKDNTFIVGAINPFAKLESPDHISCILKNAAKIIRHWLTGKRDKN